MTGQLLSSKVVVVEEAPRVRGVPAAPTAVLGAVGVTERGPVGKATLVTSFEEFQTRFGGFTQDSDLSLAAMGFFENGGSQLWVVRTVHYEDVTDVETATAVRGSGYLPAAGAAGPAVLTSSMPLPLTLRNEDALVLAVNGDIGISIMLQGNPAEAYADNTDPYALSHGQTLGLRFDGGPEQTVQFNAFDFEENIGSASAEQVAAIINANIRGGRAYVDSNAVIIESDLEGTDSIVEITGGDANAVLGFSTPVNYGSGDVGNLKAVTLSELKAVVEMRLPEVQVEAGPNGVFQVRTVATGATASLQALESTSVQFGVDNDEHRGSDFSAADAVRVEGKDPGAFANRISVEVTAASSGDASEFDLAVVEEGVYRERFPNLTLDPDGDRYLETVLNDERVGSVLIRVTDQLLPASTGPGLDVDVSVALDGGDDGLVGLDDNDFIGNDVGKTGLRALDSVQDLTLVIAPGRATAAVHGALLAYAEVARQGQVFAVLDPPAARGAAGIVDYVTTEAALLNASEFAAIYWPRVKVLNPAKGVYGSADQLVIPPSGIIAGVYARTDASSPGGVYEPPAGIDKGRMFGVLGFETDDVLEEAKRDLVYPKRINPLTTGPGLPRYIDGSRTLKGNGNFPYVAERRGVSFIERSLRDGLQFARHKNNTEGLRAQVRRTVTAFLLTQMNNGAFRSREPAKAFFVDVSDQLNTPTVIFAGKLIARVGLATNKPAEFIVLRISQDTRTLEAELAAAGA